jgi:hypothetical protein
MKVIFYIILISFLPLSNTYSQIEEGAWKTDDGESTQWLLAVNGSFSWTNYKNSDGDFIGTFGGTFKNTKEGVTTLVEFNSMDTASIGKEYKYKISGNKGGLTLTDEEGNDYTFTFTSKVKPTRLSGAWLISGRKRNGEITKRSTDGPRKTMKILVGGRFQWIAYHITNKQFLGTGGGSYTATNNIYTENIEFFSRDKEKVGIKLQFGFDVIDGDWHHSGKSSKGDPLYELWSLR